MRRFSLLLPALLVATLLTLTGFTTNHITPASNDKASVAAADSTLKKPLAGKLCGEPIQFPKGTVFARVGDHLSATVPTNYVYVGKDVSGKPMFERVSPLASAGDYLPTGFVSTLALRAPDKWKIDCDCDEPMPGNDTGQCSEGFDPGTGNAFCQLTNCADCSMTITPID